jgi:hypothetical protein
LAKLMITITEEWLIFQIRYLYNHENR